jgi:hypothetical protein
MRRELEDTTALLRAIAMFQGIRRRVAVKVGRAESFVSRVLRGERKSPEVIAAMRYELTIIRDYLNRRPGKSGGA